MLFITFLNVVSKFSHTHTEVYILVNSQLFFNAVHNFFECYSSKSQTHSYRHNYYIHRSTGVSEVGG